MQNYLFGKNNIVRFVSSTAIKRLCKKKKMKEFVIRTTAGNIFIFASSRRSAFRYVRVYTRRTGIECVDVIDIL